MFTVCPKCALTLAVTAGDLRVGQGYVRCGRCSSVFNALAALNDDTPTAANDVDERATGTLTRPALAQAQPSAAPQPGAAPAATPALDDMSIGTGTDRDDDKRLFDDAAGIDTPAETNDELAAPDSQVEANSPPADDAFTLTNVDIDLSVADNPGADYEYRLDSDEIGKIFVEPHSDADEPTGTFETIVLEGEGILQTEEWVPEETVQAQIDSIAHEYSRATDTMTLAAASDALNEIAARARDAAAPTTSGTAEFRALSSDDDPRVRDFARDLARDPPLGGEFIEPTLSDTATKEAVSWQVMVMRIAAILLVLVLIAQVVHRYRNELAAMPALNAPLTSLYATLGAPLHPRWNLSAYDVRQLGAVSSTEEGDRLVVRASVRNTAEAAQPLPLLRLTLQDRFGKRVASRDLEPKEYLGRTDRGAFLGAGQRVDAEIAVVDPGRSAVGFELDACLRVRVDGVLCAGESATPR